MELQKNVMKAFMRCMITKKARYLRTFVLFVLDLNQGPSDEQSDALTDWANEENLHLTLKVLFVLDLNQGPSD